MTTKITTIQQLASLKKGDVIRRFPFNSKDGPQAIFDETQTKHIKLYEILSINTVTNLFSLVTAYRRSAIFASPVDISRLHISATDLIAEDVWWITST